MTSAHDTFTTVLIDYHYDQFRFNDPPWNNERVNRLCWMLRCTPFELASLCRIPFAMMKQMIKKDKFPPYIALHFWHHESSFIVAVLGGKATAVSPAYLLGTEGIKAA